MDGMAAAEPEVLGERDRLHGERAALGCRRGDLLAGRLLAGTRVAHDLSPSRPGSASAAPATVKPPPGVGCVARTSSGPPAASLPAESGGTGVPGSTKGQAVTWPASGEE